MSFWYPSQKALDDLVITETEVGLQFSAPYNTECATWLGYYNSSKELQEEFSAEIISAIEAHLQYLEQRGSKEQNPERLETHSKPSQIN